MAAYDDLNVKRIFVVGIASVVVTAVTALAVQVLYYSMAQWQQSETQAASNYARQNEILRQQQEQVSVYGVDEATGNIVIPVERAIEEMIRQQSTAESSASNSDKVSSDET
jgi:sortase (surface protein transpeptidase)